MHNSQDSKYQDCDQLEFDSEPNQMTRDPISIFTPIREGRKEEHKMFLVKVRNNFRDVFKKGAAASKGDCSFYSVAQELNEPKDKGLIKRGADSDSQPSSSFEAGGKQQSTDSTKVNERLEEFIWYFVKEFETKLLAYHLILKGEIKKPGKFADKFLPIIGQGVGGAAGGLIGFFLSSPVTGGKLGAAAGKTGGEKLGSIMGNKKHTEKVAKLSDLIDLFRKDKINFRQRLAEAGFDIFQSFEMQFTRVTAEERPKKAMQLLAQDAVNRAINYYIQKKEALISEAVVLGTSKIESVWGVPILNSNIKTPGFKINYKHQSSEKKWNTASLYEKVGLVIETETLSYYEKGDGNSKTDKYGYRRLLESEIWDNFKNKYSSSSSLTETEQFTDYPYILNSSDSKKKSEAILEKINLDDKDLEEERIKETIKEVKNDILEEIKLLEGQRNKDTGEGCKILKSIKANLENLKVDEYLEKFKESIEAGREENRKYFNQLSEKQDNYHDDNKEEHRKTQAGVERVEEKINKVHEVFVEKKSEQIEQCVWFDGRPPVALFTGREKVLNNLHEALQRNQGKNTFTVISQMTSISGLGGMGKTQLARKYAADHTNYYDGNVIWINAENLTTMESSFRALAIYIHISETDTNGKQKTITSIITEIYQYFKKKKSLFIFDNAEKNDDFNQFLPLRNFSPADNRPYILITSRDREWEKGIEVINLNELELNEGVEFVKKGLDIAEEDVSEVVKLVKKLQGFPLAIQQAISYIEDQRVTEKFGINDYIKKYTKKAEDVLNSDVFKGFDNDYARTTFTTWQITIDKIASDQQYGELALKILNTIAYFAPENITRDMFFKLAGENNEKLQLAVRLLVKYSMVSGEQNQSILNIHRLVQEVTRLELKEKEKEEEVLREALELIKDADVPKESRSHVTSVWSYASNHDKLIDDFYNCYYNGKCIDKVTPLHLLAEEGNDRAINKILERKNMKSPNTLGEVVNPSGRQTPLHVAIINDKLNVIELLLRNDANVYAIDETVSPGQTTLELVARFGSKDAVKYILCEIDIKKIEVKNLTMCLYNAVCCNTLDVIKCLMDNIDEKFLQEETYSSGLLHYAAERGIMDIIKYLEGFINFGKDSLGQTPLHCAAKGGHLEVVKYFVVEKRANINDDAGGTGFLRGTPLHYAAQSGKLKVVEYLEENGAEIDARNNYGDTPLHYAAESGNLDLVKYLVEKDAEVNARNKYGRTPLHYAADRGRLKTVEYFLEKKRALIEANAKGGQYGSDAGGTPLHHAARKGEANVVKYLLGRKANTDAKDSKGNTPLAVAKFWFERYPRLCPLSYEDTIKVLQEVDYTHQVPSDPTQPKECCPGPSSGNRGKIEKACLGREAEYPGKVSSKECNKFVVEFYKGLDV